MTEPTKNEFAGHLPDNLQAMGLRAQGREQAMFDVGATWAGTPPGAKSEPIPVDEGEAMGLRLVDRNHGPMVDLAATWYPPQR